MIPNKAHTEQFCDSYHSTKCRGAGNGRIQSEVTRRLRKQVNTKRRQFLEKDLKDRIENS